MSRNHGSVYKFIYSACGRPILGEVDGETYFSSIIFQGTTVQAAVGSLPWCNRAHICVQRTEISPCRGDEESAQKTAGQAITLGLIFGTTCMLLLETFGEDAILLVSGIDTSQGATSPILTPALEYLRCACTHCTCETYLFGAAGAVWCWQLVPSLPELPRKTRKTRQKTSRLANAPASPRGQKNADYKAYFNQTLQCNGVQNTAQMCRDTSRAVRRMAHPIKPYTDCTCRTQLQS